MLRIINNNISHHEHTEYSYKSLPKYSKSHHSPPTFNFHPASVGLHTYVTFHTVQDTTFIHLTISVGQTC